MPILLLREKDREPWVQGEAERVFALQRPANDGGWSQRARDKTSDMKSGLL